MEIHHLRYFLAVAEELHFSRAAEKLGMSQPPLSKRIADLEHELELTLFTRTKRSVELTPSGEALVPLARSAVSAFDAVKPTMRATSDAIPLRVAFPSDTSIDVLQSVELSGPAAPAVAISESTTAEEVVDLKRGDIDIAVVRVPCELPGFWLSPMLQQELGVVVATSHPLAGRTSLALDELDGSTLVMFARQLAPAVYDDILDNCESQGFRPSRIAQALRLPHSTVLTSLMLQPETVMLATSSWSNYPDRYRWVPIAGGGLRIGTRIAARPHLAHQRRAQVIIRSIFDALIEYDGWAP